MAKEYIEREALEIELNHRLSFLMAENGEYDAYTSGFDECVDRVENFQSSSDVSPVRHGRWIDKGEYAVCTECGGRSGTQYDGVVPIPLMTQFCPNCGARMDGGKENAAD